MTGKYTAEEFEKSVESISSSLQGVVRGTTQSADDIVDSVKDFIFRTLNSDIDSVYALIFLLRNKEVITCTEALVDSEKVFDLLPSALSEEASADQDAINKINDLMEEIAFAPAGIREELVAELQKQTAKMVQGNKTSTGKALLGTSRSAAQASIKSICHDLSIIVESIKINGDNFLEAIRSYMLADFEDVSASVQAKDAQKAIEAHADDEDIDTQQLLLDAAVATSLVTQASQAKRDITKPKYEGDVVTLPGAQAELLGGTDPFILQDSDELLASMEIDGTTVAKVGANPSTYPTHTRTWDNSLKIRTDSGLFYDNGTNELDDTLLSDETTSLGIRPALLKYIIKPATLEGSVLWVPQPGSGSPPTIMELRDIPGPDYPYGGGVIEWKEKADPLGNWGAFGHIDYAAGVLSLNNDFGGDGVGDQTLTGAIYITYKYYPLGDLVFRAGTVTEYVPPPYPTQTYARKVELPFGNLAYAAHNRPVTRVPDLANISVPVSTPLDYATALQDGSWLDPQHEEMGEYMKWGATADSFSTKLHRNGSAHRLSYPSSAALPPLVWNTGPLGDTFTAPPGSMNMILGLFHEKTGDIFGGDTQANTLTPLGPIDLDVPQGPLLIDGNSVFETSESGVGTHTDALDGSGNPTLNGYFPVNTDGLEVGDDVYDSVTQSHAKIIAIGVDAENTTQTDGVIIFPAFPRPIIASGTGGIEPTSTHKTQFSRHRVRVSSQANDASSSISVTFSALGFPLGPPALGSSLAISLGKTVDLDNVVTDPGYNIKPGDVVLEKTLGASRPIGRVETVNGNRITIVIEPKGISHDYPFTSLTIVALGWQKHVKLSAQLRKSLDLLKKISSKDIVALANTVASSGSGQGQFTQLMGDVVAAVAGIRNAYLLYDAHTVNTVSKLMTFLKQEKMTVLHDLLITGQFSQVPDVDPEQVSSKGDVEGMLAIASDLYGQQADFVEITRGYDPLADFTNRGKEPNVEIQELPDVDIIP